MSDTPRTDAFIAIDGRALRDFARQLERELSALKSARPAADARVEEREYRVTLDIMRDAVRPDFWALSFSSKDGSGLRIGGGKVSGSWKVERSLQCRFTQEQLDRFDAALRKGES